MKSEFVGQRVAVAGLGVSGESVARAVKLCGGKPTVFDQKPADTASIIPAIDRMQAEGIEVVAGWHGHLEPGDWDMLVVSPGFPRRHPAILDMAERPTLSEVEFAYRIAEAPILAITGTNGKSTTTVMLWSILNGGHQNAYLCGNIAGSGYPEMTLTDAAMAAPEDGFLVAEISSYQLEFVSKFRPRVAAITNITPDHMDRHPDFADYSATKMRIFDRIQDSDRAVVNLDELSVPMSEVRSKVQEERQIITFSPSGDREANGQTRRIGEDLILSGETVPIASLPFRGEHNFINAQMAWEMACAVVRPSIGMLQGLREFRGLANRMEWIGERDGIAVVNNSMCTNPAAVIASSQSVPGRQFLLMGGKTKNLDFRPVGDYLASTPHQVLLFGPEPEALQSMLGRAWPIYPSLAAAFRSATEAATAGDTILLAPGCASADPYVSFRERGDAFKEMALAWIQ